MENRLCLNKKPVYNLPDEVVVGEYRRYYDKIPFNNPDLCIGSFGVGCLGKIYNPCSVGMEIWIKTKNTDLLDFIKKYDFKKIITNTGTSKRCITLIDIKKILLEEFYNKKEV